METILLLKIDSTKPVGACPFLSVTLISIQTQSPPSLSFSVQFKSFFPFFPLLFQCLHCSFVEIQHTQLLFFSHYPLLSLSFLVFDMKFLSSSSSSSSSTASFNANMCNSRSATAGCLAGVLRRLLCSGSLPTHPSDHIRDSSSGVFGKEENLKAGEKMEVVATPGIVARLMGLDSVPDNNLVCSPIKGNSIVRSRSMNSLDFWPDSEGMEGKHRRVKSSVSFRETPVFFEMENEEFLLLSFGNEGENKELRRKERKLETGSGELRQRRTERCRNKNTRRQRSETTDMRVSDSNQPSQMVCNNGELQDFLQKPRVSLEDGAKLRDEKKKNRSETEKAEPECSPENSSPVSVLDFGECINDPELPTSEENLNPAGSSSSSSSRRKLSPELENYEHPSPENTSNSIGEDGEAKKNEGKSRKTACHGHKYLGLCGDACRLVGGEMMESSWLYKEIKKQEDFEYLGADFGLQILDELLQELVHNLCELPMRSI